MENEIITLQGFITYYKYQNEQSGYKIALFKMDDNLQERVITIVGYFPTFNKEDILIAKGTFIKHPKYGLQFQVMEINKQLPNSESMIVRFLSSSTFPKVGKSTAQKIYDELKEETLTRLIQDSVVLYQLVNKKIISTLQMESIKNGLKEYDYSNNAIQLLLKHGLSMKNIMKIESVYKEQVETVLKINPYQIVIDIDGIGFKTVDKLSLSMGIELLDKRRIKSAILYIQMMLSHKNGDTYIYLSDLKNGLSHLVQITEEYFFECLDELIQEKYIIVEDNRYYHYQLYNAEESIARRLKPYLKREIEVDFIDDLPQIIEEIEIENGIQYTDEQKESLIEAMRHGLFIITGGPGTGKTTILDALIKIYKKGYGNEFKISLCAPTGRASKRMNVLTGQYACTIHRFLKWDLHSNTFAKNELDPVFTDILIVDEFSMVDTLLFDALLKGISGVSQIILIGDDGQIPSVGAGNLLYDLLQIQQVPALKLNKIFRQENGSAIINLAHDIRHQQLDENYEFKDDIRFYNIANTQAPKLIVQLVAHALQQGYAMDDIQVIIPMYANVAGIDNVNRHIQDFLNPAENGKPEIISGHQVFRLHDRVLQLKNQPDDDIFNGDIGFIIDIDNEKEIIVVDFDGNIVEYTRPFFVNLTLAYAISVHKAQGSEFKIVIMCVFSEYGMMLNKKLIYTAVSRAKKNLIILGNYQTFLYKSLIEEKRQRQTTLKLRIMQQIQPKITK